MLLPYLKVLQNKKVILGSSSATRKAIFKYQQIPHTCISSTFPQTLDKASFKSAREYCEATCDGKAQQLLSRFKQQQIEWDILIVADTIVQLQNKVLEKPLDEEDCVKMMMSLSDKEHRCFSAHQVHVGSFSYKFTSVDHIKFLKLEQQQVRTYAKTPLPYQHSGGYQLRGPSASFIAGVRGDMGFQGLQIGMVCELIIKGMKEMKWI